MKILLFSDQWYPIGGGIEQYLKGLAAELQRRGADVAMLTAGHDGCPEREIWQGIEVVRTRLLNGAIRDPAPVLARWPHMVPLVEAIAPDIIFANHHTSVAAIEIARHLDLPVVYGYHGTGLLCPQRIRFLKPDKSLCYNERSVDNCLACRREMTNLDRVTGVRSALNALHRLIRPDSIRQQVSERVARYDRYQALLESADALVVQAPAWMQFFRGDRPIYAPRYGIDTETFRPVDASSFRQKYGVGERYVLVTSRIHESKGQDWAIAALAGLPDDIQLVLAGNSSLFTGPKHEDNIHTQRARATIERLKLRERVVFTGFLKTEELVSAYSGAIATIVPSIWFDPYPNVLLEALACACPVVATETVGSAEVLTEGSNGYIVPRMDPQSIATAVKAIVPRRPDMGRAARQTAERDLNWEKVGGDVLQILERAIADRRARRPQPAPPS
ncbi:glycosyltransferase [Rubidibacter lacunae KORDI 51-2]|uniref:Glycosyltransferase n=2 Tax=Rubidibacter TaxID=582491 RepID=U5DFG8_9CHRO|nr:glycosyltransferase [Rubidibacter lacunae KORDI 51-2]